MHVSLRINKICPTCKKSYSIIKSRLLRNKVCSRKCKIPSMLGKKHSQETINKIKIGNIGRKKPALSGENHYLWVKDRSQLQRYNDSHKDRISSAYRNWRKEVWLRDNFTCKIANPDCNGRIEAHHILGWSEYPELRYKTNNGITLCHAHHPRKRAEEKRLIPTFQELVSVSK